MNLKSKVKKRVKDHGEVFTNEREVNAMLDLVSDEASRVDSRFLEPACGTGNFLVEILNRKLATVKEIHSENLVDFQKYVFMAVGSIYAIDIQEDNCIESRQRMYDIVDKFHGDIFPIIDEIFMKAVRKVLEMNVILGNGLTGFQVSKDNPEGKADLKEAKPIMFSEWTFERNEIVRKDFEMNKMIAYENSKRVDKNVKNIGLFDLISKKEIEEEALKPDNIYKYSDYKEI